MSADDAVYSTVGGTWVKVNEKTWTMDKDGDGKTDVTLIKEGDEWRYIFNVADDSSMYYGWETDIPDGYQVENGYGTKENPAVSIQYAHTPNIDNDGVQNGNYTGGVDTNKVFSVPGSSTIMMKLTADLAAGDYLVIWTGSHPDYTAAGDTAKGTKITGKVDTKEYAFNDNTITLGFHSEKDGEKEEEKDTNGYYVLKNEPYHSIRFLKSSTYGDNIYLEGAEFSLTGISDYGTSVDKTAVSGKAEDGGLVVFDKLEPGTYILKETKAPEDHDLDEKPYTVVVKKDGTFTIDGLKKVRFGSGTKTISESIAENTAELEEKSLTENVKITTKNDTNIMDELSKNTDTESSKS